ncbi:MAG: RNA polymerase sigma factor [Pirellulaceae bacterium]
MSHAKKLFETLVREHADMLIIYLRSALGDVSDVDDLFQETMVVAWRRLDDFDHTRPFGSWLRGIAKKLLQAHHRKEIQRRCTPATLDRLETRLAQLSRHPGDTWKEKLDILRGCVQGLPEHYHAVVVRRYFQEQAIEQLSRALGLSGAAVKKRLQRARALVLECMERKLAPSEHLY